MRAIIECSLVAAVASSKRQVACRVVRFQTWNLSKNLHRRIFRLKILHCQFHLISTVLVGKKHKNEWKWRNLHHWQKNYTATGSDGMDKSHLWPGIGWSLALPPSPSTSSSSSLRRLQLNLKHWTLPRPGCCMHSMFVGGPTIALKRGRRRNLENRTNKQINSSLISFTNRW